MNEQEAINFAVENELPTPSEMWAMLTDKEPTVKACDFFTTSAYDTMLRYFNKEKQQ